MKEKVISGYDALIEVFTIFRKYGDFTYPIHCENSALYVPKVDVSRVSEQDLKRLDELGFVPNSEYGEGFVSFRYGSC